MGLDLQAGPYWFDPCDLGQAVVFCSRQHLRIKIWSDDLLSSSSDQGDSPASLSAQCLLREYLLPTLYQPWCFYIKSQWTVEFSIDPFGRWFMRAPDVISTSSLLRSHGFHSCSAIYIGEMNVLQKHLLLDPVCSESGCLLHSSLPIKSDFNY